ncbi:MAG TPA: acetate kinase [Euzebyales bacterium]
MSVVLVINSGSSSIKYQLIDVAADAVLAGGQVERIGAGDALHTHVRHEGGDTHERRDKAAIGDHDAGLAAVVAVLRDDGLAGSLAAVGHRVVHGGDRFSDPTVIDEDVMHAIDELSVLAPLHNPANLTGIEVARRQWPDVPQVAVFDTAFHSTLPPVAHRYAVPEPWYSEHGVRRYGMHGTSHAFVARRAADLLDRSPTDLRLITAHLGNGASMTAVRGGRSIDTSMGLSPLEGLVMGTRSGDIDPAIVFHVGRSAGLSPDEIEDALNNASGLRGLCGDNDMRVVEERAADGDASAQLAFDLFCYRVRGYVGAYTVALGGLDTLVFTAGIGEHSPRVRAAVCDGLGVLGVGLDADANAASETIISRPDSSVSVLVVPTNEELEIAMRALAAVGDDRAV